MYAVKAASSSARAALVGLTVAIPPRPSLEKVITSITNREPNISLSSLLLSPTDMQRLIAAFASLPNKSPITLWISQVFTNPRAEETDDLINFWNAIKYKVTKVIWDQNRFYKTILNRIGQEIKQDPSVALCEFQLCDQTNSASSVASVKSPDSHGSTPRNEGSPYPRSLPFFPAVAAPQQQEGELKPLSNLAPGSGQV